MEIINKTITKLRAYFKSKPKILKVVGVTLIIIGFFALITPLTPGSWLIFVGLELLGFEILTSEKLLKFWKKRP
jgi:uncharacterized protein YqgC (DUF456 family)